MFDLQTTSAAAYRVTVDGDDFRYADSNEACRQMTGISVQFHPGVRPQDLFAPAVAEEVVSRYRACVRTSQAVSYVSEIVYLEGQRRWRTTLLPVIDGTGRVHAIIGICSPAEAADQGTLSLTDKASLALGAIDGGFWIYELADGSFETSRPLAEMLAGPGVATLNLAEYLSHVHSEDLSGPNVLNPSIDRSIVEYRVVAYDGRARWLKSRRRVIRDEAGMPVRVVGLVSDVTEQRHALEALETEATTDSLTGLKNRRAFERVSAAAFAGVRESGTLLGILLIDLDGFKAVNDRLGHRVGDELLRKVGRRLARSVRKADVLCRLGGDEFVVLLHGASARTGLELADRIRRAFAEPFLVAKVSAGLGVSIGFALADRADSDVDAVIERADRDLYAMKRQRGLKSA